MSHLKIAFVSDVIYPFIKGGAEKRIHDLSARLVKKGHEVHIFGAKWWRGSSLIDQNGVMLHGLCPALPLYANGQRTVIEAVIFSAALALHANALSFDVIDVNEFPFLPCLPAKLSASITQTPLIITWHEVWGRYWRAYLGRKGFFADLLEHQIAAFPDHCIAVSQKVRRDLISIGVHKTNITVVPNGVDLENIQSVEASNRKFDLIFVGRMIKEKNLDVLIKAVAILAGKWPSLTCAIIGDGPEKDRLVRLAREIGVTDQIVFLGWVEDHDQVISILKSSKVFVLPSSREGFSIIVAESKACGVPSIVYSGTESAAHEMIRDGWDGLLFNRLSSEELSGKIELLLSNEDLRMALSNHALDSASRYDLSRVADHLEATYRKVYQEMG